MTLAVALAMLQRQDRWLLQLRDDVEGIVAPGHWGLFGGYLEAGETAERALRRELQEEIGWCAGELSGWFVHRNEVRNAHFFLGRLSVPLEALQLAEGQDLTLASLEELRQGRIWSPRLGQYRPLAPSLQLAVERCGQPMPPLP